MHGHSLPHSIISCLDIESRVSHSVVSTMSDAQILSDGCAKFSLLDGACFRCGESDHGSVGEQGARWMRCEQSSRRSGNGTKPLLKKLTSGEDRKRSERKQIQREHFGSKDSPLRLSIFYTFPKFIPILNNSNLQVRCSASESQGKRSGIK